MAAKRTAARTIAVVAALVAGPLVAQDEGRVGLPVGEADLYPVVRIDYLVDDNVFAEADDPVEGSSVVVSPRLELVADRRLLTLRGTYLGQFSEGSESAFDYADHALGFDADAQFDKRRRASFSALYRRDHQAIGFGLSRGLGAELDEPIVFDQFTVDGDFRYGVVDARGNLEAGVSVDARRYANLDALTDGRDFVTIQPYGLFSYRLSGDTRALVELRYGAFSIDNGVDDRSELSLFGGAEFAATGRTRGAVRLGGTRASYERADREDVTLLAAKVDVEYLLREYATLRLRLDRELDDGAVQRSELPGEQAITDTVRLTWLHEWSSRLSHEAYVERSSLTQGCPGRDSNTLTGSYELSYALRRWLSFGATVLAERRSGEECEADDAPSDLDYERRVLGVHVRATL